MKAKKLENEYIVEFNGSLNYSDMNNLRAEVHKFLEGEWKKLIFDFKSVLLVDSNILGYLLLIDGEVTRQNKKFILKNPQGMVQDILSRSNFQTLLTIE